MVDPPRPPDPSIYTDWGFAGVVVDALPEHRVRGLCRRLLVELALVATADPDGSAAANLNSALEIAQHVGPED